MAIPGITYRLVKGSSLTHTEMDNNFRSVFYSSSIHDSGNSLRLHFDTSAQDFYSIPLGGTGNVTIFGEANNRVLTSVGSNGQIQAESNFTFDGTILAIPDGRISFEDSNNNVNIGLDAGCNISGECNTVVGKEAGKDISGNTNAVIGQCALISGASVSSNATLGFLSLGTMTAGNNNVAIGACAGANNPNGSGNVYVGKGAGKASSGAEADKLYINNQASDTPLILGDFSTGHVTINSTVSASVFSGSFVGDGSGLTGLSVSSEWDGSRNGDSSITGSFIVSGSTSTVDFTNVANISGSVFSGSFVGNGSGLTGVTANAFPHTGSAIISGSLTTIAFPNSKIQFSGSTFVSGAFDVNGISKLRGRTEIDQNIHIYNKTASTIVIGTGSYAYDGTAASNSGTGTGRNVLAGIAIGPLAAERAVGDFNIAIGYQAGMKINHNTVAIGPGAARCHRGRHSVALGFEALKSSDVSQCLGNDNVAIGSQALNQVRKGFGNVGVGRFALCIAKESAGNVGIGYHTLKNHVDEARSAIQPYEGFNTAIGFCAGNKVRSGTGNVYIGSNAGPSTLNTDENHKLYIASGSGYPLIGGDFSVPSVTISGSLLVSQSVSASFFSGDGSGLTNLPEAEWDGSRNGNASITGSFVVSGSTNVVDFTNVANISGSTFSGSFVGDGSGLTGITGVEWDGSRNGDSSITGSLIVSGALDVSNTITLASSGYPGSAGTEFIHYYATGLSGAANTIYTFPISSTGYTGFKGDYSLYNSGENQKKVGTLYGAWDQSSNDSINDEYTAIGSDVQQTSFSITSNGSNAILKLNASSGTYDLNIVFTAFKKQV